LSTQKPGIPELLKLLKKGYSAPRCALGHETPLQLLVATILSAQCTDERVNLVTKTLFLRYRTAADFAGASQQALEKAIHSTGFFRNKSKSIRGACRRILEEFGGEVPNSMDALLSLPGVARKTANVVLGTAFGIASGVVVDTHVLRLSRRLGLTKENSPEKVEKDLIRLLPRTEWIDFSHRLIQHGRRVCAARKPACERCVLERLCPKNGVEPAVTEDAK
jgi:endonuclease-3